MGTRLIADIGGTNARFAMAGPEGITDVSILRVADHADLVAAMATYLGRGRAVSSAAIAAAGPRDGDIVKLTNVPWLIEAGQVSRALGGAPVRLMNDLEAVALCLPSLPPEDIEVLSGAPLAAGRPQPMLAANVGTGFGAAVAVPVPGGWIALGTEAGHMSLPPADPEEVALFRGVGSAEDAFSGPGYARLFGAPVREGGETEHPIPLAVGDGERRTYSRAFGRFIGDLVLATGSWGGVFLTGGVMSDMPQIIDFNAFLAAFRAKGKMAARMERVAVSRILSGEPAFRYLAVAEVG